MRFAMMSALFFLLVLLHQLPSTLSTNPGVKVHISQNGLNCGAQVGVNILANLATKLSKPGQSDNIGSWIASVDYNLWGAFVCCISLQFSSPTFVRATTGSFTIQLVGAHLF